MQRRHASLLQTARRETIAPKPPTRAATWFAGLHTLAESSRCISTSRHVCYTARYLTLLVMGAFKPPRNPNRPSVRMRKGQAVFKREGCPRVIHRRFTR
jgi:hypothetical protein